MVMFSFRARATDYLLKPVTRESIGNLLDNAMEACLRQSEDEERFIRFYIGILKQQLYICVTNSVGGTVKKVGKTYLSTKDDHTHGFGLMRIDRLAEKYNGGGHACASGATVYSKKEMKALISDADALLKDYKENNEGWL